MTDEGKRRMKTPAPACKALLAQATARWPKRNKASDGIVPSAAHTRANPTSDHEPGRAGLCHAVDLDHDPAHGCDCERISHQLAAAKDPRVKYIIFRYHKWERSSLGVWRWRAFGGTPHLNHMHVSLHDTKAACTNVKPWPGVYAATTPPVKKATNRLWRVNASGLNLRQAPSVSSKSLAVLPRSYRVQQLGATHDGWMKVKAGTRTGYVAAKYLRAA